MRRREFLGVLGGAAAWPAGARAQQPGRVRRIGFLASGLGDSAFGKEIFAAFAQGLGALGWTEGANLHIDRRWYGADAARAERGAAELNALKPDLLRVWFGLQTLIEPGSHHVDPRRAGKGRDCLYVGHSGASMIERE